MNYIEIYFSRPLDFSGEEEAKEYKTTCIVAFVGCIALGSLLRILYKLVSFNKLLTFIAAFGLGPVIAFLWILPLLAATIRRCKYLGKSKLWLLMALSPVTILMLWFFLGREKSDN